MEKITKSRFESLPPIKLYLDDIEKIVEILGELSTEIKIETDEYALRDVKEFASLNRERLTELSIQSSEPHLSLYIGSRNAWISIAKDIPPSRGTFEKVKDLLLLRRRKFSAFLDIPYVNFLLGAMIGSGVVVSIIGVIRLIIGTGLPPAMTIGGIMLLFIGSLLSWWSFRVSSKEYSLIILKRRIDQPSFFKRNEDKILVGIIIAVVSVIFGWVLRTLIK
jgi:hypothetical protein